MKNRSVEAVPTTSCARRLVVLAGGSLLVLLEVVIAVHSTRFRHDTTLAAGAIPLFVGLQVTAGLVYLAVICTLRQFGHASGRLTGFVIVGVLGFFPCWPSFRSCR